jgi:hypothetical protein
VKDEQKKETRKVPIPKTPTPFRFVVVTISQSIQTRSQPVGPSIDLSNRSVNPINPINQPDSLNPITRSSNPSSPNAPLNLSNHLLDPLLLRPLATRCPALVGSRNPSLARSLFFLALLVLSRVAGGAESSVDLFAFGAGAGAAGDAASAWARCRA